MARSNSQRLPRSPACALPGVHGGSVMGVPPPPAGAGVCRRCRGPSCHGPECWCCLTVGRLLGEAPGSGPMLVPLALCRCGDALHGALRRYKDAPALSARRHFAQLLAALLQRFLVGHRPCLERAVGGWDALALVPSTMRSSSVLHPVCPFEIVAGQVAELHGLSRLTLACGPGRARHLTPAPDAFCLAGPADIEEAGWRVLLLDDTWVTGARARSAAAALAAAGATVVAVVVVGRTVDPGAAPRLAQWWEKLAATSEGHCCLPGCDGAAQSRPPSALLWSNAGEVG